MSPKAVQYKTNSIIYFSGDMNDKVYILKAGKISLNYRNIETGQEVHDLIQTGEFFGVKSALGKYPREETAVVLQPSQVLVFTVPEFEQIALNNTRIIMKMLKVFSNQLRRIHKMVQNLFTNQSQVKPEEGLFRIGEYYYKNQMYVQAVYAFRRYITYYPSGKFSANALDYIKSCEQYNDQPSGQPDVHFAPHPEVSHSGTPATGVTAGINQDDHDVSKAYYDAVSMISQEKYLEALKAFKKIITDGASQEFVAKSEYEIGRCLFSLEEFDKCISHFTNMIQKFPKHSELKEALFFIGQSFEKKRVLDKAQGFYQKILSMASEDEPIYRKVKRASKRLGGN